MRIIRVFPSKTSFTPEDDYAFVGLPPFVIPDHDEVHISCTFTWDMEEAEYLKLNWEARTDKPVKLGGVAYGDIFGDFVPGMYVREGVTFTTRGCNNKCPFCFVPEREGKLRELPIVPGNIIQDNNFLQASREHKDKVFQMLKSQKAICFKGGLQANLIDDHFIENIKKLRIKELWLACDTWESLSGFKKGCKKLTDAGFNRNKIFCYVLSYGKDMEKDRKRAIEVFNAGAMPFVQLFQPPQKIEYSHEWKDFQRQWSRPAIIKANMKKVKGRYTTL